MFVCQGEELFNNFKDAIDFIGVTNYEKENNITIKQKRIKFYSSDMLVVDTEKSDGSVTRSIVFKNSIKKDIWKTWTPSKSQQQNLPIVTQLLQSIDNENEITRGAV